MSQAVAKPAPRCHNELMDLGFRRLRGAAGYRLASSTFRLQDGWGVVESSRRSDRPDPLRGQLGRPGLWKRAAGRGNRWRTVFDVPRAIVDSHSAGVLRDVVEWALVTDGADTPAGWEPPGREQVEEWIPEGGLTVEAGSTLRQGRLVHEPRRLALGIPVVRVPEELAGTSREAWLRELLIDAQNRTRLVRIGVVDGGEVHAEIDLSGAPREAVEMLVRVAADALIWLVRWIVQPADLIVRGAESCRALEMRPFRGRSPR